MASAAVFRRSLQLFIDQTLSQAARGKQLAEFASSHTAKLIAEGKASPRYDVYVDGVKGAAPESVRRGGNILHNFHYLGDAIVFALGFLQSRSPVGPGYPKDQRYNRAYRDCFVVAVNGKPIPAASFNPDHVPGNAEIYIYNSQPYSRKIDVQLVGKTKLKFSTPPGLFTDAAKAVRGRFGNTVSLMRVYSVAFPGQYVRINGVTTQSPALHFEPL